MQPYSKYIILVGIVIALVGALLYFFGDKLSWIGRLPGDIRIENKDFRFYFPVATMILLSLLVNAAIWLIKRF